MPFLLQQYETAAAVVVAVRHLQTTRENFKGLFV